MFFLQVPQTSLFHKMAKRQLQGKVFIEPLLFVCMVEDTFIYTDIWKSQEAQITSLNGQDARHGFSEILSAPN